MKYLSVAVLFFCSYIAYSQCSCMGGASVGGISPLVGTTNVGLLKSDYLRVLAYYSNTYGDTYYSADSETLKSVVQDFRNSNLTLNIGYGLNDELTIESEIGYYINKSQTFPTYTLNSSGLSHLSFMLKYNFLRFIKKQIEWTAGIGLKVPFPSDEDQPIHLRASNGAYCLLFQSFLHKGYRDIGLHFVLSNRIEYNFENAQEYKYGLAFVNSLFISQNIYDNLNGILELRSEFRTKDKTKANEIANSGGNNVVVSPQLNYTFSDFGISAFFDIPVYKYYQGSQLTGNYSLGIALSWQSKIF